MLRIKTSSFFYASLVLLACFFVCHFTFSYFSKLESDDYNLIAYLRDKGFFGTIKFIYMEWEGAFGVLLISLLKIKFTLLTDSLFLHNVLSTIITLFCFYYFIKSCFVKLFGIQENQFSIILTILAYTNIYYNNLALNDTWYWLCGSIYFFMPSLLLFFTGVLLTGSNKYLIYLAYFYFFIFGASRFNYSVITLSILSLMFLFFWFKNRAINKTVLGLIILVFTALIIYVIAPGNYIRRNDELKHVLTFSDYLIGPLKMAAQFIYKYIVLKFPYHVLFLIPTVYVGYSLRDRIKQIVPTKQMLMRVILVVTGLLIFSIYIQCFSMFIAKGSQVSRTLEMLCIICCLIFIIYFLLIGAFINFQKLYFLITLISLFGASFLLIRRLQICYPIITKYAAASDEMHATIRQAVKEFKGDTLILKALPPSSWLHSGDLKKRAGSDPMNNIFLENYYKPKFVLDVEE